jgi:hypothetical protein
MATSSDFVNIDEDKATLPDKSDMLFRLNDLLTVNPLPVFVALV